MHGIKNGHNAHNANVDAWPIGIPNGCKCHYWKSEGSFVNASDRPACQTIADRGVA